MAVHSPYLRTTPRDFLLDSPVFMTSAPHYVPPCFSSGATRFTFRSMLNSRKSLPFRNIRSAVRLQPAATCVFSVCLLKRRSPSLSRNPRSMSRPVGWSLPATEMKSPVCFSWIYCDRLPHGNHDWNWQSYGVKMCSYNVNCSHTDTYHVTVFAANEVSRYCHVSLVRLGPNLPDWLSFSVPLQSIVMWKSKSVLKRLFRHPGNGPCRGC